MLAVSLGGFCSNLAAGQLIDAFGPRAPAQIGGVGAALLLLLLPLLLPPLDEKAGDADTARS